MTVDQVPKVTQDPQANLLPQLRLLAPGTNWDDARNVLIEGDNFQVPKKHFAAALESPVDHVHTNDHHGIRRQSEISRDGTL
ncbi:hypothetical protein [Rhodococcus globerulus]|uniref:hypothetical protein n=1 Tax=Rhodococcus globerulus TaxID=33008 RepID=UPI000AE95A59|nr:hypothetical protein [Rhodococcus globerulus]